MRVPQKSWQGQEPLWCCQGQREASSHTLGRGSHSLRVGALLQCESQVSRRRGPQNKAAAEGRISRACWISPGSRAACVRLRGAGRAGKTLIRSQVSAQVGDVFSQSGLTLSKEARSYPNRGWLTSLSKGDAEDVLGPGTVSRL